MAKLTWTIETSAGTVSRDSPTLNDAQMQRGLDYFWARFTPLDADGEPLPRTQANEVKAYTAWTKAMWRKVQRDVNRFEADKMARIGD